MRFIPFILIFILLSCTDKSKEKNTKTDVEKEVKKEILVKIDTLIQIPGVSFRGLHVTSENEFWAAGSKNTIVQMIGDSIFHYTIADSVPLEFRDITVWDKTNAIAMSIHKPAKLFQTLDYGYTWQEIYSDPDSNAFFDAVEVDAEGFGWIYQDPLNGVNRIFGFLTNEMYGLPNTTSKAVDPRPTHIPLFLNLSEKINKDTTLPFESGFAASGTTISLTENFVYFGTGGTKASVYRYQKSDHHWDKINTPIKHGAEGNGIYSIAFLNDSIGLATGGSWEEVYGDSVMAYTKDAGSTWQLVKDTVPNGYRSCVAWGELNKQAFAVCCGTSGMDISWDKGKTWSNMNGMNLNVIEFSNNVGFAADSKGFIYRVEVNILE